MENKNNGRTVAENVTALAPEPTPRWVLAFGVVAVVLFVGFVVLHLTGRGLGHHSGLHPLDTVESNRGQRP